MSKLLDRSKSSQKSGISKSVVTPRDTQYPHVSSRQRRPSLHTSQHDATSRCQDARPPRPKTADDAGRNAKLTRTSFFEAFAIDADDDIFAFPKPFSAKTEPKEIEILASVVAIPETSPIIGLAFGSPSHPPQFWTRYPSLEMSSTAATPRAPRFMESFEPDLSRSMPAPTPPTPTWKKVGSLFRRPTKTSKNDNRSEAKHQPAPENEPDTQPIASTDTAPVSKSRGRVSFGRGKRPKELYGKAELVDNKVDVTRNKVASGAVENGIPRLELQIPSCELERYSIMFEKVLDAKPSLLERRKSRIRMLDAKAEEELRTTQASTSASSAAGDTCAGARAMPVRRATCPSPSVMPDNNQHSAVPAFHLPLPIYERSNTAPVIRVFPLCTTSYARTNGHQTQTLFESPISSDEDELASPYTPPSFDTNPVHVITDICGGPEFNMHKNATNVWQSVLPAPPTSSTSSRFSVDVHKALETPHVLNRSRSYNAKDSDPQPVVRQVQVAVARQVSVSRTLHTAQYGDPLKPKVVHVAAMQHSRKASVVDVNLHAPFS